VAKAYSLASWNVEHFRNPDSRVDRVVDFLVDLGPPDVFGLYEVEGKEVYEALVTKMPGYTFHITEGPEVQEILIGVASKLTAFFTRMSAPPTRTRAMVTAPRRTAGVPGSSPATTCTTSSRCETCGPRMAARTSSSDPTSRPW
jgi:hypothetical protein